MAERAFLPMLVKADAAHIVNTSSINGLWASVGPTVPHTAYSAAKFAVKGFSEALLVDLRLNAPHVKVAVVMPGHIGTSIALNTNAVLGKPDFLHMAEADVALVREQLVKRGLPVADADDEQIRAIVAYIRVLQESHRGRPEDVPAMSHDRHLHGRLPPGGSV